MILTLSVRLILQDDAQVTVGIEFSTKVIEFEKSLITTHIWDTAGQDRLQSMTKAYFKNTAGAILVYDVCDKRSFENLQTKWLPQLREQGYGDVRIILGKEVYSFHCPILSRSLATNACVLFKQITVLQWGTRWI
jgi:GTPase SAR1 family protein